MSRFFNPPIFDETVFMRLLHIERRRTERSGRAFVLLLIELKSLTSYSLWHQTLLIKNVLRALRVWRRQSDITGWYKTHAAIGVIFTELQEGEGVAKKIVEKIHAELQVRLTPEQLATLTVTAHTYPHPDPSAGNWRDYDKLYPKHSRRLMTRLVKRTLDLLGSWVLLVGLAPVFLGIGLAIRLTSKGPILFKQTRIGERGRPFTFLKFRTMVTDADPEIHIKYTQAFIQRSKAGDHDPRVTRLGHFLRKTSLDELPQLLNVLAGTMSLVGPRPPLPYEVACYEPWHMRRVLEARPGITGLWQVQGRSRTTFDDMVRLDLRYLNEGSIWTDLRLLLRTPWAVLRCNGAR
jgi:lipopolysaccharide/colanic/teichoic acid biosynthesis glycosyltransferase